MSNLLGRVQILDFLLDLLKALAQWQVLSKLSFHPCNEDEDDDEDDDGNDDDDVHIYLDINDKYLMLYKCYLCFPSKYIWIETEPSLSNIDSSLKQDFAT